MRIKYFKPNGYPSLIDLNEVAFADHQIDKIVVVLKSGREIIIDKNSYDIQEFFVNLENDFQIDYTLN